VIIVDSSLVADFLLKANERQDIVEVISRQRNLAAPSLIEYELGNILRKHNVRGDLDDKGAVDAFASFKLMRIRIFQASHLKARAWELRKNVTFYDASYVALAELLRVPLYTLDKRLAAAPGHGAEIICL
jgi:predicted nucleic acid-binding protein